MERRTWIRNVSVGALGAAGFRPRLIGHTEAPASHTSYRASRLGIITNTVRSAMAEDWRRTLHQLSALGYYFVESGVPDGVAPEAYAAEIRAAGLKSIGLGGSMAGLRESLDNYLRQAEALESEYIVCYWPWLSSADALTREESLRAAANLNTLGERVRRAGFRLAWHNHDKEFVPVEGGLAFDLLMENTDPAEVTVELDWYWVVKGGADPVALFQKYPGRYELAHVKDMNNNRDRGITCVGNGLIDFNRILAHAKTGGTRVLIVENERAIDGIRCARGSMDHLKTLLP